MPLNDKMPRYKSLAHIRSTHRMSKLRDRQTTLTEYSTCCIQQARRPRQRDKRLALLLFTVYTKKRQPGLSHITITPPRRGAYKRGNKNDPVSRGDYSDANFSYTSLGEASVEQGMKERAFPALSPALFPRLPCGKRHIRQSYSGASSQCMPP